MNISLRHLGSSLSLYYLISYSGPLAVERWERKKQSDRKIRQ
jgi:hypothetical protein